MFHTLLAPFVFWKVLVFLLMSVANSSCIYQQNGNEVCMVRVDSFHIIFMLKVSECMEETSIEQQEKGYHPKFYDSGVLLT
jgi:hypothetical protein